MPIVEKSILQYFAIQKLVLTMMILAYHKKSKKLGPNDDALYGGRKQRPRSTQGIEAEEHYRVDREE